MPNIKSAKKRVAVTAAKTAKNKMLKSRLRTNIKKTRIIALDENSAQTQEAVRDTQKRIDRAAAKGIIHKNKAAHLKSQLSQLAK